LKSLIKGDWWTPDAALKTGEDGTVPLKAALSTYELRASGEATSFRVARDTPFIEVRLP
jgi:hypothetical protein